MSYTLVKTDGTFLGNIGTGMADGINNTVPGNPTYPLTNLVLFGDNYSGYGLPMNENFVKLLENSSSTTPPSVPMVGQLWWDKTNRALNIYNGTIWRPLNAAISMATPPLGPRSGQLWWDTVSQELKIYNGTIWIIVGGGGNVIVPSAAETITVLDTFSSNHSVTTVSINGTVVSVLSNDPTFLTTDPQISGFGTVGPGINLLSGGLYNGLTSSEITTALTYTPPTPTGTGASGTWGINITGNVGGSASTVTSTAQPAITSVGALLGLTINGNLDVTGNGTFSNIRLNGSSSGISTLVAPANASAYIHTLPAASDTLVGKATTDILTNKTYPNRETTIVTSSTPTPDADTTDIYVITALASAATFGAPTWTISPTQGQPLVIRIKDNGSAWTLAWNLIYRAIGVTLPLITVPGKTLYVGMIYNTNNTKWDVISVIQEA